jgi:HPt (histidine-containing phosphotransfer) domain-containing protein
VTDQPGPAIDVEALTQLMNSIGGDARIMRRLIDAYLGDAPRQLEQISAGISDGNQEQVNRGAHTLKSTSGTMGAFPLAQMSRELEQLTAPTDGGPGGAVDLAGTHIAARAAALAAELERVRQALDAFVPAAAQ